MKLEGQIRSAFAMTEPGIASSDATNISATVARDGDEYVIGERRVRPVWRTNESFVRFAAATRRRYPAFAGRRKRGWEARVRAPGVGGSETFGV